MVVTVATTAALATTMLGMVVMEAMEAMAAMAAMVHIVASETFMAEHWKLLRAGFVDVMNDETTRTMATEYHFFVFNKTISTNINVLLYEKYAWGNGLWWLLSLSDFWHNDWNKMAFILQTAVSNTFDSMKIVPFFLLVSLKFISVDPYIISNHWFRYWLGAEQVPSHYLA